MQFLLERRVNRIIACDVDPQKIQVAEKRFKEFGGKVEFRLTKQDDHSVLFEGKPRFKDFNYSLLKRIYFFIKNRR
jgi:16S rRNA C1402 N4-methylase RsmH